MSAELPTSLIPRNARLSPSLGHCNIFGRISWFIVGDGGIKADGHEVMFAVSAHGQDQESSRGDKHCRAAPAECSQATGSVTPGLYERLRSRDWGVLKRDRHC